MSIAAQLEANLREHAAERLRLAGDLIVDDTRQAASRRTGELADSIGIDGWVDEGTRFTTTIRATAEHAKWQDEGTGIYGPMGTRIYPSKPGGVLAFDWPAAGGMVFFASVAGSPGTHFFGEAMPERFRAAMLAAWL